MESLIELIKKSPKTILVTLEAVWVILLSLMGRFMFFVNLDIHGTINLKQIIEFGILFFCIVAYGRAFIQYKGCYEISSEKDKKNFSEWLVDTTIERKRIDYYLWPALDKSKFLFRLLLFVLMFLSYLLYKQ